MTDKKPLGRPLSAPPDEIRTLGDWLRAQRLKRGLSQVETAKLIGMSNLSVYETGAYKSPSMATIVQIENVFGTIPERLKRVRK